MSGAGTSYPGAFPGLTRSEILGGLNTRRGTQRVILLVDDDPLIRELAAAVLECHGFAVEEASSGREAVDRVARGGRIDLVLMDFQMPGMNGLAAAEAVQRIRPGLPVLFVTGFGPSAELQGVAPERIIGKPYREADLLAYVRSHLNADTAKDTVPRVAPV